MAAWNRGGEKHAKGGTTQEFEICVALTTQKYDWLMLEALTIRCHHSRYMRRIVCKNVKKSLSLTRRDVFTILLTGYVKSWINQVVFFLAKLFASNLNESVSVISRLTNIRSTGSPENNSENMNWLSMAFLPSGPFERLNKTFTWNFPLLSANMSLQLDDLLCQILNSVFGNSYERLLRLPNICRLLFETSLAVSLTNTGTKINFSRHAFASRPW